MPLPGSGQITLNEVHVEAGGGTATSAAINDSDIRSLIGASSGQSNLSLSDFYGASARVNVVLSINSNTNNYNIYSNRGGSYVAGKTDVQLYINSAAAVGSTTTIVAALDTGTGWTSGDTIGIINNGTVKGRGGTGGAGGDATVTPTVSNSAVPAYAGDDGGFGSTAFQARFACSVVNNGSFYGGGGGGGGGAAFSSSFKGVTNRFGGGGGGGGAGVNGGTGGSGGVASGAPNGNYNGSSGSNGTATAGGAGGESGLDSAGTGGAGGGLGSNGAAGENTGFVGGTAFGGSGGTRGYYQVGASNINGGSGIGGTVGGRSS